MASRRKQASGAASARGKAVKSRPRKPTKAAGVKLAANQKLPPLSQEVLAKLHLSLQGAAKTSDQHADAAIVGLAAQETAKGNPEVAQSLLGKLSGWVQEHGPEIANHIGYHVVRALFK